MSRISSPQPDSNVTSLSLLVRAQAGDENAWGFVSKLYRPLIRCWGVQHGISEQDAEDLAQDVLLSVVKHLKDFEHAGRDGSFRSWLRTITVNRTIDFWKSKRREAVASGDSAVRWMLDQLADPKSDLAKQWDHQHDEFVLRSLLELMEMEFQPTTLQAFRRVALEGADAETVAQELGMSLGAIYTARSRVLQRIRREAAGILDGE